MGRDLYTNGTITIADAAIAGVLAAAHTFIDNSGDPVTVDDLADHLYELASGSPYDNELSDNPDTAAVEADDTETTVYITVHDGRMRVEEWQTMMRLLAEHGATGTFFHEEEDSRNRFRSRLADGGAYADQELDCVFTSDIISYIGQMQRAPAQALDFITVGSRENDVIAALLDELRTRDVLAGPDSVTNDREHLEAWARRAGISWTVRPVAAP